MDQVINKILDEIKEETNISKVELERIIDTEFKLIAENIRLRSKKTVNLIYIGKFRPTKFFLMNYEKLNQKPNEKLLKEIQRNNKRLLQLFNR